MQNESAVECFPTDLTSTLVLTFRLTFDRIELTDKLLIIYFYRYLKINFTEI